MTEQKEKSGTTPTTLTIVGIKGMHCMSCVKSIEGAVKAMPGVSAVSVSLEKETAQVQVDLSAHSKRDVINVISECGFDVTDDCEQDEREPDGVLLNMTQKNTSSALTKNSKSISVDTLLPVAEAITANFKITGMVVN
jgi:Cu+-exporting ATPase